MGDEIDEMVVAVRADTGAFRRLKQPHRAVEVQPAKPRRVIPLAASVFARGMIEGGVDEDIAIIKDRARIAFRIERQRPEFDRSREERGWWSRASADDDVVTA